MEDVDELPDGKSGLFLSLEDVDGIVKRKTDSKGRLTIGIERAEEEMKIVVLSE